MDAIVFFPTLKAPIPMRLPADQEGPLDRPSVLREMTCSPVPSAFAIRICSSPLSTMTRQYTMRLPSGENAAALAMSLTIWRDGPPKEGTLYRLKSLGLAG